LEIIAKPQKKNETGGLPPFLLFVHCTGILGARRRMATPVYFAAGYAAAAAILVVWAL
jgi:hypothetical protein